MRNQHFDFGPWTTSLDSGSRMQLSAFWKQRMSRLTDLSRGVKMSRLTIAGALALAVVISLSPLVELVPAMTTNGATEGGYIAKFSNGVTVELIGLGENPSAEANWWSPDGVPLDERPYHDVRAHMGSADSLAREVCWRWRGIDGRDVKTNWGIVPAYNGAGGGRPVDSEGQRVEGLTAWAISLDGTPDTCTVKLTMTVPATSWETLVASQAGYTSSTGRTLPNGENLSLMYTKARADGEDTVVSMSYRAQGEVRLAALDVDKTQHIGTIGPSTGAGGFHLAEVRFSNIKPEELKTWQFQTRQRKSETVEFRNVSLHRGKVTDVETVMVDETEPNEQAVATPPSVPQFLDLAAPTSPPPATSPPTPPTPSDAEVGASVKQNQQRRDALQRFAQRNGYVLQPGQLIKSIAGSTEKFPKELDIPSEQAGLRVFQDISNETIRWKTSLYEPATLAYVLDFVLHLKPHQIECDEETLSLPLPKDWVVAWDPQYVRSPTSEEVAAMEDALNEQLTQKLSLEWKQVESVAWVVQGEYKFTPIASPEGEVHLFSNEANRRADGVFQIPIQRANLGAGAAYNSYQEMLQALGEVLGRPVVDEATKHPARPAFYFHYSGDVIPPHQPLSPEMEDKLIETLSKQTGLQFTKQKRSVFKLFVKPRE